MEFGPLSPLVDFLKTRRRSKPTEGRGRRASSDRREDRQLGAGLVEILISTSIMAVGLVGLMWGIGTGVLATAKSGERGALERAARAQAEAIKLAPYSPTSYPTQPPPAGAVITIGATPAVTDTVSGSTEAQFVRIVLTGALGSRIQLDLYKANR